MIDCLKQWIMSLGVLMGAGMALAQQMSFSPFYTLDKDVSLLLEGSPEPIKSGNRPSPLNCAIHQVHLAFERARLVEYGDHVDFSVRVVMLMANALKASLLVSDCDYGPAPEAWASVKPIDLGLLAANRELRATWPKLEGTKYYVCRLQFETPEGRAYLSTPLYFSTQSGVDHLFEGLEIYMPFDKHCANLMERRVIPQSQSPANFTDQGVHDQAILFNGTNCMVVASGQQWLKTGSFSLSFWVNSKDTKGTFCGTKDDRNINATGFAIKGHGTQFIWKTPTSWLGKRTGWFIPGEWLYLTFVVNRETNRVTFFRNGELIHEAKWHSNTNEPDNVDMMPPGAHLMIGSDGYGRKASHCKIDELALWSRPLSKEEAISLYAEKSGSLKVRLHNLLFKAPTIVEAKDHFLLKATAYRYLSWQPMEVGVLSGPNDVGQSLIGWEKKTIVPITYALKQSLEAKVPTDPNRTITYARWYLKTRESVIWSDPVRLCSADKTATIRQGLYAYFPFENNTYNYAENKIQPTIQTFDKSAKPTYTTPSINSGRAAVFDKKSWFLNLGKPLFMDKASFSIALWLKVDQAQAMVGGYLGSKKHLGTFGPGWSLTCCAQDNLILSLMTQKKHDLPIAAKSSDWAHYVITIDRTERIVHIYQNGILVKTHQGDDVDNLIRHGILAQDFCIGTADQTNPDRQYASEMDEVALWSRVLTPTDVELIYSVMDGVLANAVSAISFNFCVSDYHIKPLQRYGVYPCKGIYWNTLHTSSMTDQKGWMTNSGIDTGDFELSYYGREIEQKTQNILNPAPLLHGQLCDVKYDPMRQPISVSLKNVPFETYDVYFYKALNSGDLGSGWTRFAPILYNGSYYRPNAKGIATPCEFDHGWGDARVKEVLASDKGNVIVFENISGDATFIMPRNDRLRLRANISAMQIVDRPPPPILENVV